MSETVRVVIKLGKIEDIEEIMSKHKSRDLKFKKLIVPTRMATFHCKTYASVKTVKGYHYND